MAANDDIRQAIRGIVQNNDLIYSTYCKVEEVDLDNNVCNCSSLNENEADLFDVKLLATDTKGFLLIPKVGSIVIVTMVNNSTGFVSMTSDLEQIQLNGADFDGLVKIADLVTKLNNLENLLNSFITIYNTHTHPVSGAVAGVTTNTETQSLTPTVQSDLENTTVVHGKGNTI